MKHLDDKDVADIPEPIETPPEATAAPVESTPSNTITGPVEKPRPVRQPEQLTLF